MGRSYDEERDEGVGRGERPPPFLLVLAWAGRRLAIPGAVAVVGLFGAHQHLAGWIATPVVVVILTGSYWARRRLPAPAPPSDEVSDVTVADAVLPPFRRSLHGYDREQVNEFFTGIWSTRPEVIETAVFTVRLGGYDAKSVDRSLDGWRLRQAQVTS